MEDYSNPSSEMTINELSLTIMRLRHDITKKELQLSAYISELEERFHNDETLKKAC